MRRGEGVRRGSDPPAQADPLPTDGDWAVIQKNYAADTGQPGKYSPPVCTGTKRRVLKGDPDPDRISTSYVERQNLTMRMGMRRLHAVDQRLQPQGREPRPCRLKRRYPRTPAMAAGVSDHIWSLEEIAALLD